MDIGKETTFNKKTFEHLFFTFVFMGICWGLCIILGINGITMKEHVWLYIPWFLGGISPAIASYIVLKKHREVVGFKDWIKHVFDLKHSIWAYLLAILLPTLHTVLMCLLSGYKKGLPLYLLLPINQPSGNINDPNTFMLRLVMFSTC